MSDNIFKKIGDGIVDIAPSLASALNATGIGAPVGAALNAIGTIGKHFGLGTDVTPEQVATAMLSDPEARLKVLLAENAFKLEVMQKEAETLRAQLSDVQSARNADVEKTRITGKRDTNLYVLAWVFVVGFFTTIITMVALVLSESIPQSMPPEIVFLLGSLFQCLTLGVGVVLQYFFGSSKGSADKAAQMVSAFNDYKKAQ